MGYLHSGFATFMSRYLAELLYCPFQGNDPLKPNGELCKSYASVAELLREENRPYFKSYLKRHGQVVWDQEVEIRRAILEKIGHPAALRPFPARSRDPEYSARMHKLFPDRGPYEWDPFGKPDIFRNIRKLRRFCR